MKIRLKITGQLARLLPLPLLLYSSLTSATDAYLEMSDGSFGQGTLIKSGKECLMITPKHVLFKTNEDTGARMPKMGSIRVVYGDRSESVATVHKEFDADLALLKLQDQPVAGCDVNPFAVDGVDQLLAGSSQAAIEHKKADGSSNFSHLLIVKQDAYGDIKARPMLDSDQIKKGYSGSVLRVDNKPVGMLTYIDKEGVANAMRSDLIMSTLSTFLAASMRDKSLHLALDERSEYLTSILLQQASNNGIPMAENAESAARTLQLTTTEVRIDDAAGPVVRLEALARVIDSLDREIMSEKVIATGNSFVDMESAVNNAQANLREAVTDAALIERLP